MVMHELRPLTVLFRSELLHHVVANEIISLIVCLHVTKHGERYTLMLLLIFGPGLVDGSIVESMARQLAGNPRVCGFSYEA